MPIGKVKWYSATKGFGFLAREDGEKDVFVHISAVERSGLPGLNENDRVDFEIVTDRGKPTAAKLKLIA